MTKQKELIKNTIIIMLGKFCTQFISFSLVPFYTFFLTTDEYGTVDLITTYIGLLVPVLTIQLEMAVFRFFIDTRNNKEEQKKIFTNILLVVTTIVVFISIIAIPILYAIDFSNIFSMVLCIVATIYSNLLLQVARGRGNNKNYSIACVISALSNILFNILFVAVIKMNVSGALLATAIANALSASYVFVKEKIIKLIDFKLINKKSIYKYVKYSFPLVPNTIMWWIINASDRTIISIFIGATANGIYAVSHKFSTIVASIYNVFNLAWTESTSLHINDKDKNEFFSDVLDKVIILSTSLCCGIISVIPFCFDLIIGESYHEAKIYIPALLIGSFFNNIISFIGSIYIALKRTDDVAKTSLLSGILNIIINVIFVKKIGLWASAISTILAFLIMCIYRFHDVQKYVKLKIRLSSVLLTVIEFTLAIICYYINNFALNVIILIFIVVTACITNIEVIKQLLNKLKRR